MKITRVGTDFIEINEDNMYDEKLRSINKVHLIKLNFINPTEDKVKKVISLYPKTNRFVVSNNIKDYNSILKWTNKKYYVQNNKNDSFISFLRKNNKILLDVTNLSKIEKQLVMNVCFEDMLKNIEVIKMSKSDFIEKESILKTWNGNVIIDE